MIADDVFAPWQFLHDSYLVFVILFLFLSLTDELLEGVVLFKIEILDQEDVAVASLCDLVDLLEAFAVDVEDASASEPAFDKF